MELVGVAGVASNCVSHVPCVGLCKEISRGALLSMLPDAWISPDKYANRSLRSGRRTTGTLAAYAFIDGQQPILAVSITDTLLQRSHWDGLDTHYNEGFIIKQQTSDHQGDWILKIDLHLAKLWVWAEWHLFNSQLSMLQFYYIKLYNIIIWHYNTKNGASPQLAGHT